MSINYEWVAHNKLFAAMSSDHIEKIFKCAAPQVVAYQSKEIIINQGEPMDQILVILQGELGLFKEDYDGNRSLVGTLGPDNVYGQTAIFGDFNVNMLTVEAEQDSEVLFLNKSLFYRTCSNACPTHQIMIKNMLSLLANQANVLDRKINYLTAKTLRSKVARFLLEERQQSGGSLTIVLKLNREELAEYFDVQRPSLSRELIKLKEENVIDYHKHTFQILDLEKLQAYAR